MQSYKMQDIYIRLDFEKQVELKEIAPELKYTSR